jgi:hypothetical protein
VTRACHSASPASLCLAKEQEPTGIRAAMDVLAARQNFAAGSCNVWPDGANASLEGLETASNEEDPRRQQQRQCFSDSRDRPSPECVSVPFPFRVEDEHALGAWPGDLDDRFCRSGHSA